MDAKEKPKDAVPAVEGDSAGKTQRDSNPQKTYTEDEVEAKFSQQRSVLDKKIAEQDKRLKTYAGQDATIANLKAQMEQMDKEKEEALLESIKDDPDALKAYRLEQKREVEEAGLTEREAKLAKRETELADIVERDRILIRTQLAAEVAVEKGVSIDAILKLAKEDTREAMEVVADVLPKVKELPVLIPDSGKIKGGEKTEEDKQKEIFPTMFKK